MLWSFVNVFLLSVSVIETNWEIRDLKYYSLLLVEIPGLKKREIFGRFTYVVIFFVQVTTFLPATNEVARR